MYLGDSETSVVKLDEADLIYKYAPYHRHYNLRFVYFKPLFEGLNVFSRKFFEKILPLRMVSIQEWVLIKSGL